jgi:hypothetical protein
MSGAHIARAARRRRQRFKREEEAMTSYTPQDLEGWEFKIIRGAFRDPEFLAAVLDQEALAGWELVETFDKYRLRLKRRVEARHRDADLPGGIDPYRTQYGHLKNQTALVIMAVTSALLLAAGLLTFLFLNDTISGLLATSLYALFL